MSEEQPIEEVEKELWERVAREEGSGRADSYIALARIAYNKGKFKESIAMCEIAREYFENNDASDHQHEILDINIGISKNYEELHKPFESAQALDKAIVAARVLDLETLDDLLRDQGRYWFSSSEYEKSLACHQEAMELSGLHLKDTSAGVDYLNIGMCYKQLNRFPEAIEVLRKAREYFKSENEPGWIVTVDGELTEVYIELGNSVEIQYYGQRALDYHTMLQSHRHMWWLKYYLGIAHRLLGQDDEAIDLFEEAKSLALAMGYQEWEFLIKIEKEMAEMFLVQGRVSEANEIFRRIKSVEDIVKSETVHEAA
ncbi:NrfG FOG, TPR repeat [Candidatus Nanopelagicaceae bacterium]